MSSTYNIILILFYIFCDMAYYISIYFIPLFTYMTIGINIDNLLKLFSQPYIGIQFNCSLEVAQSIFKIFCLCSSDKIKHMHMYNIQNLNYLMIYNTDNKEALKFLEDVYTACGIKYNTKINFQIVHKGAGASLKEYFWLYIIFMTSILMLFRYKSLINLKHKYWYLITSLLMGLNCLLLFTYHTCYKHNITYSIFYYNYSYHLGAAVCYLLTMYIIDTLVLLLNIKKYSIDEKD